MSNHELLLLFHAWITTTPRAAGTIALRLRHAQTLAQLVPLLTVTPTMLEDVFGMYIDRAAETRKSILSSWHVLFGWARRRGIRPDDPTLDLDDVRVPVRIPRVAPDEDIERALAGAAPDHRAMILLGRYACLRLTELTTLHTRNREGDMLRIIGKGDRERMVGINEPLMFALHALERAQGRGYYFPGKVGPHLHPQSVHKIILRVTGWNPHSLRHAGATAAYNSTHDLEGVRMMLGHSSLATTQRYLHLDADALRRVAAATVIPTRSLAAA